MDTTIAIGAGLGIGLAVLGAGIGQGIAANGALNGMARQPEIQGRLLIAMIVALALIESLVILTFVIASGLAGKVPTPGSSAHTSIVKPMSEKLALNSQSPVFSR